MTTHFSVLNKPPSDGSQWLLRSSAQHLYPSVLNFLSSVLPVLFLLILSSIASFAQESPSDTLWVVETKDGNLYTGTLEDMGVAGIRITTPFGVLTIPRDQIVTYKIIDEQQFKKGGFWFDNPHTSRHFWGPSGYGLGRGEGYYQNTWVLLNQVSYGIHDYFTVGVGMIPLFLFGSTEFLPVWVTPKVNIPYVNGKGAFGAGTILLGVLGSEPSGVGILYGVNTFGTRDRQLTVGLGYGYDTKRGFAELPTISLSGLVRTSPKWALVSENYLIAAGDFSIVLLSAGARYVGKKMAIDFGGILPVFEELDQPILLPWLSITIPFNPNRALGKG